MAAPCLAAFLPIRMEEAAGATERGPRKMGTNGRGTGGGECYLCSGEDARHSVLEGVGVARSVLQERGDDKTEFRVLILGVDKAGKTTLLEKLKSIYLKGEGLPHDRIGPTVGLNIGRIEDANVKLVFWDLGGQPGLRTIWEKYYDEAHAIVYVIDSASASTFEDAKSALEKVLRHEDLQEAPLLVFANKQDLPAAVTEEELDRHLHLKEFDERPYMFVAGSAYDGQGYIELATWKVDMKKVVQTSLS
ncbi:ADP-ribosylation factor-like protein 1 [Triticum urartu]|uniref:ADP-ribosylation factor-like protein 1 n=1 Tax=Triticum urartu TaxID=4572 RepID=M7ZU18_TRIUA|nr:ADP-ribosylation factor-like protein 1 [Triticum urartu]